MTNSNYNFPTDTQVGANMLRSLDYIDLMTTLKRLHAHARSTWALTYMEIEHKFPESYAVTWFSRLTWIELLKECRSEFGGLLQYARDSRRLDMPLMPYLLEPLNPAPFWALCPAATTTSVYHRRQTPHAENLMTYFETLATIETQGPPPKPYSLSFLYPKMYV